MKRVFRTLIITAGTTIALNACVNFPYIAPTQQGNYIEASRIDNIRQGMSRNEIANAVGSPVLVDIFHANRWDYIYTLDKHYQPMLQRRITVWFENDIAIKVERDLPVEETKK